MSRLSHHELAVAPDDSGLTDWCEQRAKEIMLTRWPSELTVAQIAREYWMQPAEFERAFHQKTGTKPQRYLAQIRVSEAQKLLLEPHLSLAEIRVVCGFRSQRDFTRDFMHSTGESPTAWRRRRRGTPRATVAARFEEIGMGAPGQVERRPDL